MSTWLSGREVARLISSRFPGAVQEATEGYVLLASEELLPVCRFLRAGEPDLVYLNNLTAADYLDYIEVVYHLSSLERNHKATLKLRCYDRAHPEVPSLTPLWQGADLQEREVWDLFGVTFVGHPNLRRLLTWEGFVGHPLRKDFITRPFPQYSGSPVRKPGKELGLHAR